MINDRKIYKLYQFTNEEKRQSSILRRSETQLSLKESFRTESQDTFNDTKKNKLRDTKVSG